ncbi:MAG: hypothetical protein ACYCV4_05435 [Dermatophilaceae bacterium]
MALEQIGTGTSQGSGVAFLVSAGIVYEIIAASCSSPQTTEINASTRAGTLMKWVHVGLAQSALFVGAAVLFDRAHAKPILLGGGMAAAVMYASYWHAKRAGLANPGPGTEGRR